MKGLFTLFGLFPFLLWFKFKNCGTALGGETGFYRGVQNRFRNNNNAKAGKSEEETNGEGIFLYFLLR